MAELLFRVWADPAADVSVASAGTHALVGEPMDTSSAAALEEIGLDHRGHRARQFETWMAKSADLILTATLDQRDLLLTQFPAAHRRAFAMKEFVRLVAEVPPDDDPRWVVAAAASRRGRVAPAREGDDDILDPYRAAMSRARSVAAEITDTVHATLGALGLLAAPDRPPGPPAGPLDHVLRPADDRPLPH